jgi:hypothetical protein
LIALEYSTIPLFNFTRLYESPSCFLPSPGLVLNG